MSASKNLLVKASTQCPDLGQFYEAQFSNKYRQTL